MGPSRTVIATSVSSRAPADDGSSTPGTTTRSRISDRMMAMSTTMKDMTRLLVSAALVVGMLAAGAFGYSRQEQARVVPAPAVDEPPSTQSKAVAVVAGGCFWGVQGVYQHLKGVTNAVSGYAGGEQRTA